MIILFRICLLNFEKDIQYKIHSYSIWKFISKFYFHTMQQLFYNAECDFDCGRNLVV